MASENTDSSVCYPNFEVGMQFFFVYNERRHTRNGVVTITKIGRKWITLSDGHRFDRTSMDWRRVDGGEYSSPGQLWDSEQQYRDSQQVQKILRAIQDKFRWGHGSEAVSLSDAEQAAKLLGVEVG